MAAVLMLSPLLLLTPTQALKPGTDFRGIHFNLNVHGVPDGKSVSSDSGSGRHSIFVPLDRPFYLYMAQSGSAWQVYDCDATADDDSDGIGEARINLPGWVCTAENELGLCTQWQWAKYYNVYVVGLAKPTDTEIVLDPEAEFPAGSNTPQFRLEELRFDGHRKGGKNAKGGGQPKWENATDLFFLDVTVAGSEGPITYTDAWVLNITELVDYWWSVDQNGNRLMQIRFYPVFNGNGNGNGGD